jgi:hypothetical protein
LIPQATDPSRALDYDNLVYACSTCNVLKKDVEDTPDPCQVAFSDLVKVAPDGSIEALEDTGRFLIDVLRLDNDENTEYRRLLLEIIRLATSCDRGLYVRLMGFPDDLPDLSSKRPPGGNSQPGGIRNSFMARRQRGELDETY